MIIAVTGLNTAGYGVLKSLQNHPDHELIGLAYGPLETCLYQDDLMKTAYLVPSPGKEIREFLARISRIKSQDGLDLLIPNLPGEIPLLVEHLPALTTLGIRALLPSPQALENVYRKGSGRGRKRTGVSFSIPSIAGGAERVQLPSLGKAPVRSGPVPPDITDGAFSLALLTGRNGRIAGMASLKKLLTSPDGSTWMGVTVDDRRLSALAAEVVRKTGWTGPLTIDMVRDKQGEPGIVGTYPVFPDWINFAALAGANLPALLVDLLLGRKIPRAVRAAPGHLFVRAAVDVVTDIERCSTFSLEERMTYDGK